MNTQSIYTALALVAMSQAIISEFKPLQRIWYALDLKPWPPSGAPWYLVPLTCGPCFAYWSTLIALTVNGSGVGFVFDIGLCSFSYLASKFIHKIINRS